MPSKEASNHRKGVKIIRKMAGGKRDTDLLCRGKHLKALAENVISGVAKGYETRVNDGFDMFLELVEFVAVPAVPIWKPAVVEKCQDSRYTSVDSCDDGLCTVCSEIWLAVTDI